MTIYTVHAPEGDAGAVEELELVKEGFCWPALFIPLLWLLYRRQWLGLLAYVVGNLAISAAAYGLDLHEDLQIVVSVLFGIVVAMHANDWRRWRLEAGEFPQIGVVSARNLEEAETLWIARWVAGQPVGTTPAAPAGRAHAGSGLTPFATPFDPI